MSRPIRPIMPVDSNEVADLEGRVLWWTRTRSANPHKHIIQVEVVHLRAYTARLTGFDRTDRDRVLFTIGLPLPHDGKLPPTAAEIEVWRNLARVALRERQMAGAAQ